MFYIIRNNLYYEIFGIGYSSISYKIKDSFIAMRKLKILSVVAVCDVPEESENINVTVTSLKTITAHASVPRAISFIIKAVALN